MRPGRSVSGRLVGVFLAYKKILGRIETRTRDKSTLVGCDQFETSPEAIEQELRTAFCERRQTDRLKTNYRIDSGPSIDPWGTPT